LQTMNYTVKVNIKLKQFYMEFSEHKDQRAILDYRIDNDGFVEFYHAAFPEHKTQAAGHLATAGMEWAIANKKKVRLSCDFMIQRIRNDPKNYVHYKDHIVEDPQQKPNVS